MRCNIAFMWGEVYFSDNDLEDRPRSRHANTNTEKI